METNWVRRPAYLSHCQALRDRIGTEGAVSQAKAKRIQYIDRLRGVAVLTMFFVHPAVAWMTPEAKESPYFLYTMRISGMVAPTFLFLAGISVAIIADRGAHRGISTFELKKKVTIRGLQIFLIGYGLHLFSFLTSGFSGHWLRVFKVDVLNCIGLCLMSFPWIAWPKRTLNIMALVLFLVLPFAAIVTYRLPVEANLPAAIAGFVHTDAKLAQFPVIPYGAWIALGLLIGPLWTTASQAPKKETVFWLCIAIAAIALFATGKGIKWAYYNYNLDSIGVDTPQRRGLAHLFWMKAGFVMGLFLLGRITDSFFNRFKLEVMVIFGKTSLFAYCVHLLIIYNLLGRYLGRRLDMAGHFIASILLSLVMFVLTRWWQRLDIQRPLTQMFRRYSGY